MHAIMALVMQNWAISTACCHGLAQGIIIVYWRSLVKQKNFSDKILFLLFFCREEKILY